jgi:EAL and modified HD-GYP domain-containing signal transduction protein
MSSYYFIGRQPILNSNENIVAYELLFRTTSSRNNADILDNSQASANVIINTLSNFGLESILGPHRGFINLDQDLLLSDVIYLLPKKRVVLELLESIRFDRELVERCRLLKEEGFILALDDHAYDAAYEELYHIVQIIKIDLLQTSIDTLPEMVKLFKTYPVKLLAEKIETREDFLRCRDMGFDMFQGYYFATPSIFEKKRFDEPRVHLLKLLQLLTEDADLKDIELAFRESPGMTYKLLLLVNSVFIGLRVKIQNIRQVVVTLGIQRIKRWVQLALYATDEINGYDDPLLEMAAVRSAFLEQLVIRMPQLSHKQAAMDHAFMTGIFSLLETIYSISINEVMATLHVADEVRDALTDRHGLYGTLLTLVELIERMEFKEALQRFEELGLSEDEVIAAQMNAFNWRDGLQKVR